MIVNGGTTLSVDTGLLGVEIGRNKVRVVLLDAEGQQVGDAVERPIAKAGGPREPIDQEQSTRAAITEALDHLHLSDPENLVVGATIGFPNCGVGSGPALQEWLESLSDELDEEVLFTGGAGVSYAPVSCVDFVQRVFEPTGLRLRRVELAPVAAARVLGSVRSGAIALGSGVAWSARLLNNQVLEAFETIDGSFDDELQVMVDGIGEPVDYLDGVELDEAFGPGQPLSPSVLAPAVGVAVALLEDDGPNLLSAKPAGHDEDLAEDLDDRYAPFADEEPGQDPWDDVEWDDRGHAGSAPAPPMIDPHLDDLGSIQDELRAHRVEDTHRLRRLPRTIERSRELPGTPPPITGRTAAVAAQHRQHDQHTEHHDDLAGLEAFAHPGEIDQGDDGFHVSDFLLGALLMLAIVLVIALVVL